jgi:hypothetical protein
MDSHISFLTVILLKLYYFGACENDCDFYPFLRFAPQNQTRYYTSCAFSNNLYHVNLIQYS